MSAPRRRNGEEVGRTRNLAIAGWLAALGLSTVMPEAIALEPSRPQTSENRDVTSYEPISDASERLSNVIDHPAFAGFGHHLLPRAGRSYDPDMTLADIASLLPYHSNVRPDEIVAALNRLVDDVSAGQRVFYPIYGAEQIAADPAKADTGLFFFRGKIGAPLAMIAPGGGFAYVGTVHEGLPYASIISDRGYNAFVIRYRVGLGQRAATEDMAAAIAMILRNAESFGVASKDYSVWGSSAGARMAALIGSHGLNAFGGDPLPGPSAVVMAYTSHSDIASVEPPTFVIVGDNDGIAPPASMERRVDLLRSMAVPVQYRIVPGIGHGFGTGLGTPAEGWIEDAVDFWQANLPAALASQTELESNP